MRTISYALFLLSLLALDLPAASIWVEGEAFKSSTAKKHAWYHGNVKKELLSGGDFVSSFGAKEPAEAAYEFNIEEAGDYEFWMRANPIQASLSVQINGAEKTAVSLKNPKDSTNIAADGKPDLRFIAWVDGGSVPLKKGKNRVVFFFESKNSFHGSLDCFLFTNDGYEPRGTIRPEQAEEERLKRAEANKGWTEWQPGKDPFEESAIDLRGLNEKFAGEHGHIIAKGERLVRSGDGEEIRFWAVNGVGGDLNADGLARSARMLAKHGVNMVRMHGAVFDGKTGELDPKKIASIRRNIAAMKKEGIYTHLSIYFPLWLKPTNGPGWREGYDGTKPAFALLYFEPEFQKLYRSWIKALMLAKDAEGLTIADDPAVAGIELINEDSFFFWTFDYKNIPQPQMVKLERKFGKWAEGKYGSIPSALEKWNIKHKRDDLADRRLGFRLLYSIFTDKTLRDQDTAQFLFETQRDFYKRETENIRSFQFKGLITASNWQTANNDIFGPLEKYSYTPGDIIDRHGYFGGEHKGDSSAWSIRDGHTYADRSALTFDGKKPGSKMEFSHPAMDIMTNLKPSMISETTWTRPNRYRGEAPLYFAAYGALQGTDAIVHFALDGADWSVKPGYFMQPWTLMAPTQMGQFPAAALIFRKGLVSEGKLAANMTLSLDDAFALRGTNLSAKANLDALREADVTGAAAESEGIDPLIHYVGRTNLSINHTDVKPGLADLSKYIDRKNKTVTSNSGELKLDYGNGLLAIKAPAAQGALGDFKKAGKIELPDLSIASAMEVGQIVAVSLDGKPLAVSGKILLQVMTEEKASGFETRDAGGGLKTIVSIGKDPWMMRDPQGVVKFKRSDAAKLKVTVLDANGYPVKAMGTAEEIRLDPKTVYYLLER